ncbi:hypothetical protein [Spiroplasma alleghenense]|uniref:Uncharacterized protein n=1 Tax=Spiroplasma alleghenense TaxID=216931 RepID=A0A345Z434_9MOLU|nr:hypothetical protein [Spiroplasma alleghenense]AXK51363.1 hypothetical protein SALLE_v1c06930 [Spiroplasma alleghenense]
MFNNERYEWMSELNVGVTFVTWFFLSFSLFVLFIGLIVNYFVAWRGKSEKTYQELFDELNSDNGYSDIKMVKLKKGLRMPFRNYRPVIKEYYVKPWELEKQNLSATINLFFNYTLIIETREGNSKFRRSLWWMTGFHILALLLGLTSIIMVTATPYGLDDVTLGWIDFWLQVVNYCALGLILISWISLSFIFESLGKQMTEMAIHYLPDKEYKKLKLIVNLYAFFPLMKNPYLITRL